MKKNVKYLGMAAAALLAVAPVATTGVANAATVVGGNQATGSTTTPASAPSLTFNGSVNATVSTKPADLTTLSAVQSDLKVSGVSGASIVGIGKTVVADQQSGGNVVSSFEAGHTYWVQTTVAVAGLKANETYSVNGKSYPANRNGVIENIPVAYSFVTVDAALQGQPYFVDNTTTNHVNLGNGAFAYKPQSFTAGETIDALMSTIKGAVSPMVNIDGQNKPLTIITSSAEIASQLANQGVTVSNGKISASATSFYVTVATVNPANGKTATAKIQFNKEVNQNVYPAIYQEGNAKNPIKQGNAGIGLSTVSVGKGSKEAIALAKNPISYLKLKAYTINNTASGQIDLSVLSNKIDPNTVGVYPVTLRATNPNGYTTDLTFNVIVNPVEGNGSRTATVQYKEGYGVNIWNVLSSTNVSFSGHRAMAGSTVTIYGEKTVNGVKYYQIGSKDSNDYIQAQYIDGASAETTTKPSTDNKGEESVSGVLTVRYDGKGKVGLTNAEGKYTGQYVSKNSRWKVFAKKTINGREFYRIGNQNQWIPAQYSELED
ncbi:SLAP domain-containing protein [Lactobacillus sp. PV034]|uniref:SLAP domain-containing protein n=1 Tax=Lactobacillus sp. PV034 TaxID=2594495 RepID=UPI002240A142|nr:SLAP domain-containing protein [Lactobacillus sp. PV034]